MIYKKVVLLTWNTIHKNEPKLLCDILPNRKINENLRSASEAAKIGIPTSVPTRKTRTRFLYTSLMFNQLPDSVRGMQDDENFKKALKKYIFSE